MSETDEQAEKVRYTEQGTPIATMDSPTERVISTVTIKPLRTSELETFNLSQVKSGEVIVRGDSYQPSHYFHLDVKTDKEIPYEEVRESQAESVRGRAVEHVLDKMEPPFVGVGESLVLRYADDYVPSIHLKQAE